MGVLSPPYVLSNASSSAALFRQAISSIINSAGGVCRAGDMQVSAGTGMQIVVGSGGCWVPGSDLSAPSGTPLNPQGLYFGFNDGNTTLTVPTADPTNPRIDIVVATVQDAFYSGTNNDWLLQIITGTPAPSPSQPATPGDSLLLASYTVAANASAPSAITDQRIFAACGLPAPASPIYNYSSTLNAHVVAAGNTSTTGTVTIEAQGYYLATYNIACYVPDTTAGVVDFYIDLYHNGAAVTGARNIFQTYQSGNQPYQQGLAQTTPIYCNAGDTVGLAYTNTVGSADSITFANNAPNAANGLFVAWMHN